MQVQGIGVILTDPLSLPCAAAHLRSSLDLIGPATAEVVGIGHFDDGEPLVSKIRPPVTRSFHEILTKQYSRVLLAAAVRASAGTPHSSDVQPFRYRNWSFMMPGRIDEFVPLKDATLAMPTYIEKNIRGHTVPEVLFHQFLAFLHRQGLLEGDRMDMAPLRKALKAALSLDKAWFGEEGPDNSLLVTDGTIVLGAALGRPVYVRQIEGIPACVACGGDVDGRPVAHPFVRGVAILDTHLLPAGEWQTVGPNRIFQVGQDLEFETFKL